MPDQPERPARHAVYGELMWPEWNPTSESYGVGPDTAAYALLDAHAAEVQSETIPDWEAVYEPGNVSDYLIGYANSEVAAKGAAVAWVLSQSDTDAARLEWEEQPAGERHDHLFDLTERHDDGVDTDTGVTVRRRSRPYTADDIADPATP
ncbi:hypothetical protein [Streptomyces sp. NBC_01716]|uniref:hypothetical protein n=1 Tax=Streptomyces sp. NBC_01716 TaxID=2975917 RepID=UPI002E34EC0C|nr:hypothetical protein [Streptomyces sp. NBC_01716]